MTTTTTAAFKYVSKADKFSRFRFYWFNNLRIPPSIHSNDKNTTLKESVLLKPNITYDKAERIHMYQQIWKDKDSIVHRLPEFYKERFWLEWVLGDREAVHWVPKKYKYEYDILKKVWIEVENRPIIPMFPPEADTGLWAGDGVIKAHWVKPLHKKRPYVPRRLAARIFYPYLRKNVIYSEVLNKYMPVVVTPRFWRMVDKYQGLEFYLFNTPDADLRSKLGCMLKREALLAIADNFPGYGADPEENKEKKELLRRKYADYKIPRERAEWVGLDLNEACEKQMKLEESVETHVPLKMAFEKAVVEDLREEIDEEEVHHNAFAKTSDADSAEKGWFSGMFDRKKTKGAADRIDIQNK